MRLGVHPQNAGTQITCFYWYKNTNIDTPDPQGDGRRDAWEAVALMLACPSEEAQVLSLLALLVQKYKY